MIRVLCPVCLGYSRMVPFLVGMCWRCCGVGFVRTPLSTYDGPEGYDVDVLP